MENLLNINSTYGKLVVLLLLNGTVQQDHGTSSDNIPTIVYSHYNFSPFICNFVGVVVVIVGFTGTTTKNKMEKFHTGEEEPTNKPGKFWGKWEISSKKL